LDFLERFLKNTQIKFHKHLSSGGRNVPCRQTDGQPDMTKLDFTLFRTRLKSSSAIELDSHTYNG